MQHAEAVAAYMPRRAPIGCKADSGEAIIHSIAPDADESDYDDDDDVFDEGLHYLFFFVDFDDFC